MANGVYNRGLFEIASAAADLDGADLRVLLVNSGYVFSKAHNVVNDVLANEISAAGYARQTLANKTVVEDDTNNRAYLDADDPVFPSMAAGQTIGGAVVFRHTGDDATAPLILFIDVADVATAGTAFTLTFAAPAAGGICYLYQP
jgi:hypothetical protein